MYRGGIQNVSCVPVEGGVVLDRSAPRSDFIVRSSETYPEGFNIPAVESFRILYSIGVIERGMAPYQGTESQIINDSDAEVTKTISLSEKIVDTKTASNEWHLNATVSAKVEAGAGVIFAKAKTTFGLEISGGYKETKTTTYTTEKSWTDSTSVKLGPHKRIKAWLEISKKQFECMKSPIFEIRGMYLDGFLDQREKWTRFFVPELHLPVADVLLVFENGLSSSVILKNVS